MQEFHLRSDDLGPDRGLGLDLPSGTTRARLCPLDTLHTLDILVPDTVDALDLEALPSDLVLHLHGGRRLTRLRLPQGQGCRIHLNLAGPPRLRIDGSLTWLDACWPTAQGNRTLTARWNETSHAVQLQPLQSAWLGPADEAPHDVQLLAVCDACDTTLELSHHEARALVVDHAPDLTEVNAGVLDLIYITGAPALAILGFQRCKTVSIAGSPALSRITGSGSSLTMQDSAGVDVLAVEGPVADLHLHRLGPRILRAPQTARLHTTDITRMIRTELAPNPSPRRLDSQTRMRLSLQALANRSELSASDQGHLVMALERKNPWEALELLCEAIQQGAEPQVIWKLRMTLARRIRRAHAHGTHGPNWFWPTADLSDRSWAMDLRLWRLCRQSVPSASSFGRLIQQSSDPDHLAAVACDAVLHPEMLPLLAAQLARGHTLGIYRRHRRRRRILGGPKAWPRLRYAPEGNPDEEEDPVVLDALQRTLRALVTLRTQPETPALIRALCSWVTQRLPNATGLTVLGMIHGLGSPHASHALADIAAHPDLPQTLVHRALLLQLAEPQSQLFAYPGEELV